MSRQIDMKEVKETVKDERSHCALGLILLPQPVNQIR